MLLALYPLVFASQATIVFVQLDCSIVIEDSLSQNNNIDIELDNSFTVQDLFTDSSSNSYVVDFSVVSELNILADNSNYIISDSSNILTDSMLFELSNNIQLDDVVSIQDSSLFIPTAQSIIDSSFSIDSEVTYDNSCLINNTDYINISVVETILPILATVSDCSFEVTDSIDTQSLASYTFQNNVILSDELLTTLMCNTILGSQIDVETYVNAFQYWKVRKFVYSIRVGTKFTKSERSLPFTTTYRKMEFTKKERANKWLLVNRDSLAWKLLLE